MGIRAQELRAGLAHRLNRGALTKLRYVSLAKFICGMASGCALLGLSASTCLGQHTVVRDAGGGRKIELIYNGSGEVAETRTVDSTGKIQVRVEHEYRSGFLVPQETTTSYWPDGKAVRSVIRASYDENANFTSEAIQVFDQTGMQTGGTKLTHDPFTGIYRCSKWDPAVRAYQARECPAGEESAEVPKRVKDLSREEAVEELDVARLTQRREQSTLGVERISAVRSAPIALKQQIGVILPEQLRPGERVSGSVVENPQSYESAVDLRVVRMDLPSESPAGGANLRDWAIEVAGQGYQRAATPVTFTVPQASEFTINLRQAGNAAGIVSSGVTIAGNSPSSKPPRSRAFEAPALCLKGDICPVRGAFSVDGTKTFVAFGNRPASVIAETKDTAWVSVPAGLATGPTHLILAEGSQIVALPVEVAGLSFSPERRELRQGETLLVNAVLSGPEELADQRWSAGAFSAAVVKEARKLVPDLEPPQEGKDGVILVVIRNMTPEAVSLRGSRNQTFVFKLTSESFKNGEFKYHFVVEAGQSAAFAVQASILPFLAPVRGQQFKVATDMFEKVGKRR